MTVQQRVVTIVNDSCMCIIGKGNMTLGKFGSKGRDDKEQDYSSHVELARSRNRPIMLPAELVALVNAGKNLATSIRSS